MFSPLSILGYSWVKEDGAILLVGSPLTCPHGGLSPWCITMVRELSPVSLAIFLEKNYLICLPDSGRASK